MRFLGYGPLGLPHASSTGGDVSRLGLAHNGEVVGSTNITNSFFRVRDGVHEIASLGNGRVYSIVSFQGRTYLGCYSSTYPAYIWDYATFKPVQTGWAMPTWRPKIGIARANDVIFGGYTTAAGDFTVVSDAGFFPFATTLTASPECHAVAGNTYYFGTNLIAQGVDTNVTADVDAKVYATDTNIVPSWETSLVGFTRVSNIWVTPSELWCLLTGPTAAVAVLDRNNGAILQTTAISMGLGVSGRCRDTLVSFRGVPLFPNSEGLQRLTRDGIIQVAPYPGPGTVPNYRYAPGGSAIANARLYISWGNQVWAYDG